LLHVVPYDERTGISKGGVTANVLSFDYPFLEYASTYILDHAEDAQRRGVMQKKFCAFPTTEHENFEQ